MKVNDKTAILLGATGLTGRLVLEILLNDDRYKRIILFSRSSVGIRHQKLEEHLVNLFNLEEYSSEFNADEVYCCIGTTSNKTPNKDTYKLIDYGIPLAAAKLAHMNSIDCFIVISALGANSKSKVFYNRIKGEMEEAVFDQGIKKLHILQPSLIGGIREEKRAGEWAFKQGMKLFDFLLVGTLKKYKTIAPETIANAMVWLANNEYSKVKIESDVINTLVN